MSCAYKVDSACNGALNNIMVAVRKRWMTRPSLCTTSQLLPVKQHYSKSNLRSVTDSKN